MFTIMADRQRYLRDPEKRKAYARRWALQNPEKAKAQHIEKVRRNPSKYREISRASYTRRRTRKAGNGGHFTPADIAFLKRVQRNRCAECRKKAPLEIDHIKSVLRGGTSNRSNLQLLCLPCNRSKGAKDPILWALEKGRLL